MYNTALKLVVPCWVRIQANISFKSTATKNIRSASDRWLMEKIDLLVPWEPLIVRSIVHLLEETGAGNERVTATLGYQPEYDWRDTIRLQVAEMQQRQQTPMRMAMPDS